VLFPYLAELGIVQQQIREFASLLNEMNVRESGDPVLKSSHAQNVAENIARIVKAERLVEVAK
jgi:hypothetical protein